MQPSDPTVKTIKTTIRQFWLQTDPAHIPFGVGCAWLGQGYPDRAIVKERLAALETAYKLGFRYYDTARAYGNSEWVVGEFVASIPRQSIFLATKFNLPKVTDAREAAAQSKIFLEESLLRLKTDHLDLYQIHDSDQMELVFPEGGVLDFLLDARRQGLIRHIGMAFRNQHILETALRHAAFDTILTWGDFSPFNQSASRLIEQAARQGVGVINGSPLYEARQKGLDFSDPRVLSAVLNFPRTNPGIDLTLTGPASRADIESTFRALHIAPDPALWEAWGKL
jgi:aryl-alcohol dehydrogenase-like predicted oxidoreductase